MTDAIKYFDYNLVTRYTRYYVVMRNQLARFNSVDIKLALFF